MNAELHFVIPGAIIGNQARLYQKLDSIYFLDKRCFSFFLFEVDFVFKIEDN